MADSAFRGAAASHRSKLPKVTQAVQILWHYIQQDLKLESVKKVHQ